MWNVNGCSEVTRALFDTCEYLAKYPIVALTETQRPDFAPALLEGYEHFAVPSPIAGRRGYGLAVYVRDHLAAGVTVWKHDAELSVLWLKFPGAIFGVNGSVMLAVVYLPPAGSHRVHLQSQQERLAELASQVSAAERMGHIVLCGDFNALVSGTETQGINAAGTALLNFCEACDLILLTGRLAGDVPAVPSFAARVHTGASRPDHCVVSRGMLPHLRSLHVDTGRGDSDHHPLQLTFRHCSSLPPAVAGGALHTYPRLRWNRECLDDYHAHLHDDDCVTGMRSVMEHLVNGDSAGAAGLMRQMLLSTAELAGMKAREVKLSKSGAHRVRPVHKPWFDGECKQLKAAVRAARAAAQSVHSASVRAARAAFNKAANRKRRRYRKQRMTDLLAQLRDPRRCKHFWDALNLPHARLPPHLGCPSAWTDAMSSALNPPDPDTPLEPGIMEGSPPAADGNALAAAITREEVLIALHVLKNYKACGTGGCPSELLKYALLPDDDPDVPLPDELDVASHLAHLLNIVFEAGEVPTDWNTVLVSPIFKKGDKGDTRNYRPIAVSDCFEKLYASVLNARLVQWLEANGLRAPCQSGYRPHLGTEHQLFALRHIVEDCRRKHLPLYACFLDFAKAYDSVPRHLLWHIMQQIGVHPRFLGAVQSMYRQVTCRVNIGGVLGSCFDSCKGVKQGCPLSPTLFGVFIDRFYFMLVHQTGGNVGPVLRSGTRVPTLFYADDGTLLATNPTDMHRLCACLDVFCRRSHMRLNLGPGKTEMLLFAVSAARRTELKQRHTFVLAGQPVRYVEQYKYLGCYVHERWLFGVDFKLRASRVLVQTIMMRRGLDHPGGARSVRLGLRMYDVKVRPSATYGSCVWAPRFHMVAHDSSVSNNELEKRHLDFLRSWCHLRGSEPKWLIYRELGRLPLHYFWWRDIVRFANRLARLPDGSWWKEMLNDSQRSSQEGRSCWAGQVAQFQRNVGYQATEGSHEFIDEARVLEALRAVYDKVWDGLCRLPREAPDRARLASYLAWFDSGRWLRRPSYLFFDLSATVTCTYMRFRLGTHSLQVEVGRWRNRRPRCQRICERCAMHVIDDERHLVFECPAFEHIRAAKRGLFTAEVGLDMKCFMSQRDQKGVFWFILHCLREVEQLADVDRSLDVDLGLSEERDSYASD